MLFPQPTYDLPDLPTNLTELADDVVMELLSQFTGWQNYAAMQLAQTEVVEAKAEAEVRRLEAWGMVGKMPKPGEVLKTRAEVSASPEVERARDDVILAYAQRKLQQVIYANCERCVFVVSRELSRRIGGVGAERRVHRWNP